MSLNKDDPGNDPIFYIFQVCKDANLNETAHMLEQESGYFFDLKYFENLILNGKWEEVEKYLSSFTGVNDNYHSTKIYFEIRKVKYYEALYKNEHPVALDILRKDLRAFEESNRELYREMTLLLTIENFREQTKIPFEEDSITRRKKLINALRPVIEDHPVIKGRTKVPQINMTTLDILKHVCAQADEKRARLELCLGPPL